NCGDRPPLKTADRAVWREVCRPPAKPGAPAAPAGSRTARCWRPLMPAASRADPVEHRQSPFREGLVGVAGVDLVGDPVRGVVEGLLEGRRARAMLLLQLAGVH